jgi:hypothetical protein
MVCGGININYLIDNERKNWYDAMLNLYSLFSKIHFPTGGQNGLNTVIDNT